MIISIEPNSALHDTAYPRIELIQYMYTFATHIFLQMVHLVYDNPGRMPYFSYI